jgi:two-component system OmpR family sensor kinase
MQATVIRRNPSLRAQLTLVYSLVVAVVLLVFGLLLYVTLHEALLQSTDQTLVWRTQQVRTTLWPASGASLTAADLARTPLDLTPLQALDAPGLYVRVFDNNANLLGTSDNLKNGWLPIDYQDIGQVLTRKQVIANVAAGNGRELRVLNTAIKVNHRVAGVLQVGESLHPINSTMTRVRYILLALGALALAAAAGAGWLIANRGLRPLARIAQVAAGIRGSGDFSRRIDMPGRSDEIGTLASSFDQLLGTVEETLLRHKQLVADCSHELRTPLLVVRGNLDLLSRIDDPAERAECIEEARAEAARMQRMVTDLLLLARVDRGQVVELLPVRLDLVLREVYRLMLPHAGSHLLSLAAREPLCVLGDSERLKQVVINLVENALRYTPDGGSVMIGLDSLDGSARIWVRDTGIGIAAAEQEQIFGRFYRVDRSRGRNGAGAGLGLTIVRYLVEAHGGTVRVESRLGEGSTFFVTLPLAQDESTATGDAAASMTPPPSIAAGEVMAGSRH